MSVTVRRLGPDDIVAMRALNAVFADAFETPGDYDPPPPDGWLAEALAQPATIVLVAEADGAVQGGLVAYVLTKLEQARREVYLYDLAVAEGFRRRGIASALIAELRRIAAGLGAWVIFVQGDQGDDPAIALYTKLGTREDVLHFDIPIAD